MSELRTNLISNATGNGPTVFNSQWASKANVRYNQTGNSLDMTNNVSSATDHTTGEFTITFTNSFNSSTYALVSNAGSDSVSSNIGVISLDANNTLPSTSSSRLLVANSSGVSQDRAFDSTSWQGDLT